MADLIDRAAIIDFIYMGNLRNPLEICFSERDVVDMLESRPAVDAVEIVRCKDCKHLMFSDCYGECGKGKIGIVSPNDFCSYGERKEGADNAVD